MSPYRADEQGEDFVFDDPKPHHTLPGCYREDGTPVDGMLCKRCGHPYGRHVGGKKVCPAPDQKLPSR